MNTPGIKIHTITTYELAKALEDFVPGIWTKGQCMNLIDSPPIQVEVWRHLVTDDIYICPMRKDFPDIPGLDTRASLEELRQ